MNVALKEWSAITAALNSGRQIAILRKGGIVEADRGGFQLRHNEFLFFPTYEHQHASFLEPGAAQLEARPGFVEITSVATAEMILQAPSDPEILLEAASEFVWNEAFVRQRYEYRPDLPLWLVLLRVRRLPETVLIPDRLSYAGCKSWVNLTEEISIDGAVPVLSDEAFAVRRLSLLPVRLRK